MANLNRVLLIGNLTRDPEVRYTPKGQAVAEIALAVNRSYTLDNGEKREETTFVDITLWGRQAEVAGEYLKKGRPLFVEGRLQLDSWDDKTTGQKRSKMRVVCESFQMLGSPGGAGGARSGGAGHSNAGGEDSDEPRSEEAPARPAFQKAKPPATKEPDLEEDDIPF